MLFFYNNIIFLSLPASTSLCHVVSQTGNTLTAKHHPYLKLKKTSPYGCFCVFHHPCFILSFLWALLKRVEKRTKSMLFFFKWQKTWKEVTVKWGSESDIHCNSQLANIIKKTTITKNKQVFALKEIRSLPTLWSSTYLVEFTCPFFFFFKSQRHYNILDLFRHCFQSMSPDFKQGFFLYIYISSLLEAAFLTDRRNWPEGVSSCLMLHWYTYSRSTDTKSCLMSRNLSRKSAE